MNKVILIGRIVREPEVRYNGIWMKVTSDELELPVAIADSAEELARITGAKANSIRSLACRRGKGKKNSPYIRMEIDEEEEK